MSLDYIRENLRIVYRLSLEYKVNFWTSIFEHNFYVAIFVVFFHIFYQNFADIINWRLEDFVLMVLLIDMIIVISYIFVGGKPLFAMMQRGQLNNYLTKPKNVFKQYFFHNLSSNYCINFISNLIVYSLIIYFYNIKLYNLVLGFFIFLLLCVLFLSFFVFWGSLDFYFKRFGEAVYQGTIRHFIHLLPKTYPIQFFSDFKYKNILLFSPSFFVSFLLVPVLRNDSISNLSFKIFIIIILIVFFNFITFLNWKFGLKRYEGFD